MLLHTIRLLGKTNVVRYWSSKEKGRSVKFTAEYHERPSILMFPSFISLFPSHSSFSSILSLFFIFYHSVLLVFFLQSHISHSFFPFLFLRSFSFMFLLSFNKEKTKSEIWISYCSLTAIHMHLFRIFLDISPNKTSRDTENSMYDGIVFLHQIAKYMLSWKKINSVVKLAAIFDNALERFSHLVAVKPIFFSPRRLHDRKRLRGGFPAVLAPTSVAGITSFC